MAQGKLITVSSVAASQFRGALAQHVGDPLALRAATVGLGMLCECRVKSVRIVSVQNLDWEVQLYRTASFQSLNNPDGDRFAGRWSFVAADAVQVGGAGLYHYYIDGNDIDYWDESEQSTIYLLLVNRSAAGKAAGDAGGIRVELAVELGQGR